MSRCMLDVSDMLYRYVPDHSPHAHPAQTALRQATRDHPHADQRIVLSLLAFSDGLTLARKR